MIRLLLLICCTRLLLLSEDEDFEAETNFEEAAAHFLWTNLNKKVFAYIEESLKTVNECSIVVVH